MSKIKIFEAFAGYGSQSIALRNIGVDYEVAGISEIDKYAIQAYEAIHGKVNNLGDISKIDVSAIPSHDLFTYSFPCFVAGTKVLTDTGYKNIEDIQTGDKVLTHTNLYQEVVKPMINKANHLYKVDTMCSDTLYTTEEHPFYIRKRYREWNNEKRMYDRKFKEPQWIKAKDLDKNCYVGIAINQESKLPKWNGSIFHWSDGRKDRHSNILKDKFNMPEFWWMIGRYFGDGWIRHQGGIIICCDYGEENEIISKLKILNFNYSLSNEKTNIKIHITFKEIGEYVEQFGKGAKNKHLTNDILDLPIYLLKSFIEGYLSADGCYTQGLYKITSISNELIYGVGECIAKVYKRPFSIYKTKRSKTTTIENRIVNQQDSYQITWKTESKKQDKAFYDGTYIWCPINSVEKIDYDGLVYNMEVANDNSYTVNNIIVHNCQDISAAGKTRGIIRGQTRSGLLYECEKIIEYCKPKYLLLENVKNLVSKKFEVQFIQWLKYLNSLGYTNYWKVLNAKDYGVPQNRERVFVVSILGEHKPYKFPKAIKLTTHIKDILEDEVDEKYYLSQKWQDTFTVLTKPRLNTKLQLFQTINNKLETQKVDTIKIVGNTSDKFSQNARVIDKYGVSPTLLTSKATKIVDSNRIRYITPRESFRLMGLNDDDIDKIQQLGISDNQQYKLAGNSIVVNVLEAIFQSLFKDK